MDGMGFSRNEIVKTTVYQSSEPIIRMEYLQIAQMQGEGIFKREACSNWRFAKPSITPETQQEHAILSHAFQQNFFIRCANILHGNAFHVAA